MDLFRNFYMLHIFEAYNKIKVCIVMYTRSYCLCLISSGLKFSPNYFSMISYTFFIKEAFVKFSQHYIELIQGYEKVFSTFA